VRFDRSLGENIVFAAHNLVTDRSFNEFHVIMCRNVMIYFERALQEDVFGLLHKSLVTLGVLALGTKESLGPSSLSGCYENLDGRHRIYRRVS